MNFPNMKVRGRVKEMRLLAVGAKNKDVFVPERHTFPGESQRFASEAIGSCEIISHCQYLKDPYKEMQLKPE